MHVESERKTRLSDGGGDPLVGRTVAGFRIDSPLGEGGMGVVYKATQVSLNRTVAVKVLPESFGENPQFLERFRREVDILSRLAHPNIVTVLERGEVDGRPWLAMEYVAGTTLRDVMRKGPLPRAEALAIVRAVLAALEHAHDAGIVHRDIKPENVLLAPGGVVKVADFGLSRLMEVDGDRTRLTHTHLVLGTYEYMSPEQREYAREADERSDLYATGVVLYEMIAGELPIGRFEPLSVKRPSECDRRIDEVVERSLEKDPARRWQRASEMGAAVSRLLTPAPDAAPTAPGAARPRPAWRRWVHGLFGEEFAVARVEGRLPRRFAERVLEEVVVQRWLAAHVTLWRSFPGGISFHVRQGRIVLELEGQVPPQDDPVRDKRLAALVGAVLEANSDGLCRRIAVADPAFEEEKADALANPPRIGGDEAPRPSAIPVESTVVSAAGVAGTRRGGRGVGSGVFWGVVGLLATGIAIAVASLPRSADGPSGAILPALAVGLGVMVLAVVGMTWHRRRGRANWRTRADGHTDHALGLGVTALWVAIVMVAVGGDLRDEHVAWLCAGAIASVFLVPRLPRILAALGRSFAWLIVVLVGVFVLASTAFLFLGPREAPAPEAIAESTSGIVVGRLVRPVEQARIDAVVADPAIRDWVGAVTGMPVGEVSISLEQGLVLASWERGTAPPSDRWVAAALAFALERRLDGAVEATLPLTVPLDWREEHPFPQEVEPPLTREEFERRHGTPRATEDLR